MTDWKPINDEITLTRDADYVRTWQKHPRDPTFPPGTTAELVITRTNSMTAEVLATWPAVDVTSDAISFWVQSEDTNQIPDFAAFRLMVHYPPVVDGAETQDWCWYRGPVKRKD
ncbi:DUF7264 domain-containing protein [Rhodococcus pyridinivorans]|uniref:LtfC-like domain-containing protein n=1 Tax=Rhodococcus pyridinivorans TaxID=103816 RepID=UPI003AAA9562